MTTFGAGFSWTEATSASRTTSPGRRVELQVADVVDAVPVLGRAPDRDVVGLPVPEDVADLLAVDERRGGPADVTGLEPVPLGGGQVRLDLDLGQLRLVLHLRVGEARDPLEGGAELLGLGPQDLEVGALDPDDDRMAGAGQHLPDPLLQVGLDVGDQARVVVHDRLDLVDRLVVVDLGVDADPVLAELRPHRLVRLVGLADVGAEVADPGDGGELLGRRRR